MNGTFLHVKCSSGFFSMLMTVPSVYLWFLFIKRAADLWIPSNFVVLQGACPCLP